MGEKSYVELWVIKFQKWSDWWELRKKTCWWNLKSSSLRPERLEDTRITMKNLGENSRCARSGPAPLQLLFFLALLVFDLSSFFLFFLPFFDFDLDSVCFHSVFFLWVLCCLLGFGFYCDSFSIWYIYIYMNLDTYVRWSHIFIFVWGMRFVSVIVRIIFCFYLFFLLR